MTSILWIGGTSALARTFFDEFLDPSGAAPAELRKQVQASRWVAAAPTPPRPGTLPAAVAFVPLDLSDESSVRSLFDRLPFPVDAVVLGARLSLVWGADSHTSLASHMQVLVACAAAAGAYGFVHLSSVAVANHVASQRGMDELAELPSHAHYRSSYDAFKRETEDSLSASCSELRLSCVHLRLSGILSNHPSCIQCTAIRRQARIGAGMPRPIDFNSSLNVGVALWLCLGALGGGAAPAGLPRTFYYTRPTLEAAPVAYSRVVDDYRAAHGIRLCADLPAWLADAAVAALRLLLLLLARALGTLAPAASSTAAALRGLEYLLAVAAAEHSFDNTRFRAAFPQLPLHEETLRDAFSRIRLRQLAAQKNEGAA